MIPVDRVWPLPERGEGEKDPGARGLHRPLLPFLSSPLLPLWKGLFIPQGIEAPGGIVIHPEEYYSTSQARPPEPLLEGNAFNSGDIRQFQADRLSLQRGPFPTPSFSLSPSLEIFPHGSLSWEGDGIKGRREGTGDTPF